jgi:Family of unknown function (DUF5398)
MFGLEDKKSDDKPSDFVFDLEKDLNDSKKNKELKKMAEERIQKIKVTLRSGSVKEEFDQYGVLLHGYTSLLKVLSRFKS